MSFASLKKSILLQICAAAMLATIPAVHADDGDHKHENDEARYRHSVMEAMGSSFGALALIMTNRVARPDQLATQAKALAISASVLPTLFPAGSEGGDALPLIWQEQDKVTAAAQKAVDATAALAAAAEAGDRAALTKAFKAAGESCKGCHERYKAEDE